MTKVDDQFNQVIAFEKEKWEKWYQKFLKEVGKHGNVENSGNKSDGKGVVLKHLIK